MQTQGPLWTWQREGDITQGSMQTQGPLCTWQREGDITQGSMQTQGPLCTWQREGAHNTRQHADPRTIM